MRRPRPRARRQAHRAAARTRACSHARACAAARRSGMRSGSRRWRWSALVGVASVWPAPCARATAAHPVPRPRSAPARCGYRCPVHVAVEGQHLAAFAHRHEDVRQGRHVVRRRPAGRRRPRRRLRRTRHQQHAAGLQQRRALRAREELVAAASCRGSGLVSKRVAVMDPGCFTAGYRPPRRRPWLPVSCHSRYDDAPDQLEA